MYRKLLLALTLVVLLPTVLLAEDGKIRGRMKDKQTGDPLIGANVTVEGTKLGAATDINGDYIILGVPAGVHTLKASAVGYAPVSIANIRVSSNTTTTQDFQLSSSAVQLEGVEIVAERPLIQRNTTNTVRLTTQDEIQNLPFRGVQGILAVQAGVVQQNGNLYVRGGRNGEVSYFVDGAGVTNPVTLTSTVNVIQEAIEELQLQAGGYTAEIGGGNSAVVRTAVRTGGRDFRASVDYQTDDFAKPGSKFLGTTPWGFRNVIATFSGPIVSGLTFFVAGQNNFLRDRDQRFITPFRFDSLVTDVNDRRGAGVPLPGPVVFSENYLPGNFQESNTVQGTLLYDISPMKFRLTGSYQGDKNPNGSQWPDALQNYFRQRRVLTEKTNTLFGSLRASHVLGSSTFYEVSVSYQRRSFSREDPDFGDNWRAYTDSVSNANAGYTGFPRRYSTAADMEYSTINSFKFNNPNAPNNTYQKNLQQSIGVSGDFTSQISGTWELKAGGKLESWKTRLYNFGNIQAAMAFLFGDDGNTPRTFASAEERRVKLGQRGTINHFGYDVDGNEADDALDGPRKPLFVSGYVQNKFEFQDLVLNLGIRYERFDTKAKTFPDPLNPPFDVALDVIDQTKLVEVSAFQLVLPRLSFSFPVTSSTVFYAMYGKYAQMPSLNQLYVGNTNLSRTVSASTRGNAFLTPVGFLMKPERTTQYELGFRQLVSEDFAFTLSGFYKDLKDQLAVRSFLSPSGTKVFTAYLNEDFGTVKGLELTLELRRTQRFAVRINYTLSDALGTGSDSRSAFGAVEQNIGRPTNFIGPLGFNQTHRGSLFLDYRWVKGDGPLEGLGLSAILTFNSGHNYTKIKEPSELGQASPWNVGIRPLIDPRSSFPSEPLNSSKTPWVFNIDLNIGKVFYLGSLDLELYVNVLNLLNTKSIVNVYPSTGTAQDDGWLNSPLAVAFAADPLYSAFYRAINNNNRWAYTTATGNDLFGTPRQVRFGVKVIM